MAHHFRGIFPTGINELATILGDDATTLRITARSVDWVLRNRARNGEAALAGATLGQIKTWAAESAIDLRWRATAIEDGQRAAVSTTPGKGLLGATSIARFALESISTPATRGAALRAWLIENDTPAAVEELRRITERIDNWSGSDNDPILDDLVRQAQEWRTVLGVTTETMVAVTDAMFQGQTPSEIGLPDHLFPAAYLEDVADYQAKLRQIAELEAESQLIVDQLAEARWGSDEFRSLHEQLATTTSALDETQKGLDRPQWDAPAIHRYILTNPVLDYRSTHQAAGEFLVRVIARHPDSLEELTAVAELLDRGTTIEAQAFFNDLGPVGIAALPGQLGSAANTLEPGGPVSMAIRRFSQALATASHRGLGFSGSEILPPYAGRDYPDHLLEVNPAMLFLHGRFDTDFIIDAALRPHEHPEHFTSMLDGGPYGTAFFGSIADLQGGQVLDMRTIMLERVAELGPDAAVDFVAAAAEQGVLDEVVRPHCEYIDHGYSAGAILAQIGHDIEAARALVATIGAKAAAVPPGIAAGAENMFLPHVTALIHGPGEPSQHLVTPISPLANLEEENLDSFLRSLFLSGAGTAIADEVDETIVFEIYTAAERDVDSAHLVINNMNDELGQMVGRVEAAEFLAGEEMAKNRDRVNSARARISGMLLEAGISLVPVGRLAGITWNTAAQVGTGMAADLSVGALTDRAFPTDAVQHLYRAKIEDIGADLEKGTRLTIALLHDMGMVDATDMPADHDALQAWLDNTYVSGTHLKVDDWVVPVTGIYSIGQLKFNDIVFG